MNIHEVSELREFSRDPGARRCRVRVGTCPSGYRGIIAGLLHGERGILCVRFARIVLESDAPVGSFARGCWQRASGARPPVEFDLIGLYTVVPLAAPRMRELELKLRHLFDATKGALPVRFFASALAAPGEPHAGPWDGLVERLFLRGTSLYERSAICVAA